MNAIKKKKTNWTSQWLYFLSFYTNKALRESTTPFCHSEASALLQILWKLWVVGTGDPFPAGNFCRSSSREKSNNQTVSLQSSGRTTPGGHSETWLVYSPGVLTQCHRAVWPGGIATPGSCAGRASHDSTELPCHCVSAILIKGVDSEPAFYFIRRACLILQGLI